MNFKQTINCIVCGKKAKSWTGHVLLGKEKIIAGWCKRHANTGYCGKYDKRMGKIPWSN